MVFGRILFSDKIGTFKTHHTTQSKIAFWSEKRKGNNSDFEAINDEFDGSIGVGTIVSDDDSKLRSNCKHEKKRG